MARYGHIEALAVIRQSESNAMFSILSSTSTLAHAECRTALWIPSLKIRNTWRRTWASSSRGIRLLNGEAKFNVMGGQKVAAKASHALREIAEIVPVGINCPHNVTHGIHQLPRCCSNGGKRRGNRDCSVHLAANHFAQNCNL